MRKGRFEKKVQRRSFSSKFVALMLACVLLMGGVVGGTVAWLTAQDTPVVNEFSASTIGVELKEHKYDAKEDKLTTETTETGVTNYKMIPGWTIPKDPEAWITENSEAAYLFVKVEESNNFDFFMTYAIADGWTLLTGVEGFGQTMTTDGKIDTVTNDTYVIYREVAAGATATAMDQLNAFPILENDQVSVIGEGVTAEMMNALNADDPNTQENESTYPTLTFTAYAHQLYESKNDSFDVNTAWNNVNK